MQTLKANAEGQSIIAQPCKIYHPSQTTKTSTDPVKHQQGEGGVGFSKNKSSRQKIGCGYTGASPTPHL